MNTYTGQPVSGLAINEATERAAALCSAPAERVVVTDGAMGTMLQAREPAGCGR